MRRATPQWPPPVVRSARCCGPEMPTIRQARSSDWPGVVAVFAMVIGFTYSDDLVELGFVVAGRGGTDTRWAVFLVDILLVLATAGLAWRMAGLDARRFVVRLLRSWWPVGAVAVVVLHILTAAISASTGLHLLGAVLFALAMGVVLVSAERIQRVIGSRLVVAVERLMGLVLVSVAIEMMLRGFKTFAQQLARG
mgnify:CR=1 FL=1